jgi:hypothetical protein
MRGAENFLLGYADRNLHGDTGPRNQREEVVWKILAFAQTKSDRGMKWFWLRLNRF